MISGGRYPKTRFSVRVETLEQDAGVVPLSPFALQLQPLLAALIRPGERLPFVIGTFQRGAFRSSVAYWIGNADPIPVRTFADLSKMIRHWNGGYPDPPLWHRAEERARREAESHVQHMERAARQREDTALQRQVDAARLRLLQELSRYLACLGEGTADLNRVMYNHMARDMASAARLKQCMDRLGGYPEWSEEIRCDVEQFIEALPENRRKARLAGVELEAALRDPRWAAASISCARCASPPTPRGARWAR